MEYTQDDIGFILYNNRSKNIVRNFLPELNVRLLLDVEKNLGKFRSIYEENKFVTVDNSELDITAPDINVCRDDVIGIKDIILEAHKNISTNERDWLNKRGINDDMINRYRLGGLSCIEDKKYLDILGVSLHPVLKPLLEDDAGGQGITIPLFDTNDNLINCGVRRISDIGKLKYALACPDVDTWGLDDLNIDNDIWICEGIFDLIAIQSLGLSAISPSNASWSGIQLTRLIEKRPKSIILWVDDDETGMRNSAVMYNIFKQYGIEVKCVISEDHKDPAEHILENNCSIDDLKEIEITKEMINQNQDGSFNFLKYLKNRKF